MLVEEKRKLIKEILELFKKAKERDDNFTHAIGEFAPDCHAPFGWSSYYDDIISRMWYELFEKKEGTKFTNDTWLDWYWLECDFGKKESKAYIDDVEYVVKDDESFIDLVIAYGN